MSFVHMMAGRDPHEHDAVEEARACELDAWDEYEQERYAERAGERYFEEGPHSPNYEEAYREAQAALYGLPMHLV